MKLLADECVARAIVERLRADGHDVEWIDETAKSSKDIPVLNRAASLHVPLLTEDLDFGRYIFGGAHTVCRRCHPISAGTSFARPTC